MTDKEVERVVATAVRNIEEVDLELKTVRKISPRSNIWKILCANGGSETEFTLYVFPDVSAEELSDLTRERLSLYLPRWETTKTV